MDDQNTHIKARQAEADILLALHRFGYLTATQVAALVYPNHAQGLVMARRTLLRMNRCRLVLIKKGETVHSEQHYALSEAGAREVFQVQGMTAQSGKDLMRICSPHRDAANWAAIHMMSEGYDVVWTERDIQAGRAPFKIVGKKIPDFMGVDAEGYVTWGEVEASRRGGRDMQSLVTWLRHTAFPFIDGDARMIALNPPQDSLLLRDVRFVIAEARAETFPDRLQRALVEHGGITDPVTWGWDRLQFQVGLDLHCRIISGFPPSSG